MKLLLDTHLLLWSAEDSERLSPVARGWISDRANELVFSVASVWEIAVKHAKRRPDFVNPPELIREGLLDHGYRELQIVSEHVIRAGALPLLHRDPFDRLLLGQAAAENCMLLTADAQIARYPGLVKLV